MKLKSLLLLTGTLLLVCSQASAITKTVIAQHDAARPDDGETPVDGGTVKSTNGIYTVTVAPTGTTVASLGGTVTFTPTNGSPITIDIGTGLILAKDGSRTTQTLASIVAAEKAAGTATGADSVTGSLTQALQTVADNTRAGSYGNGATSLLAALTKVLVTANPTDAAEYVDIAVSGVTASGSGVTNKQTAVTAIVESAEAAYDSKDGGNPSVRGSILAAAVTAAKLNGVDALNAGKAGINAGTELTIISTPITPIDPTTVTVSPAGGR